MWPLWRAGVEAGLLEPPTATHMPGRLAFGWPCLEPGLVSAAWWSRASVKFLQLTPSQRQSHFLSKCHRGPGRGDQQTPVSSFVLAERGPPPLSAGRKAKLEKRSEYDFTEMGPRPWAAPQARGWHSGMRRCGSCHRPEPVQHRFPSSVHGMEIVGAQRDCLDEAMPEMTPRW